jgi:phosphoribosylaminoimidazolecarboxamide formyltransferase/IMP cyclohydrolase
MSDYRGKLALLSVTDKTGIESFARGLAELGYTILSTGGTAKTLRDAGIKVCDVSEYTGSPEIMDGRVKTLHPKVHGAILYDRANPAHVAQAKEQGIGTIDVVAVNLYNFQKDALEKGLSREQAIEHIDVGGPTMIRAAAKNWMNTLAVIDPSDYAEVLTRLRDKRDDKEFRGALAAKVFARVSAYDGMIAAYLAPQPADGALTETKAMTLVQVSALRYGENPQQQAGLYRNAAEPVRGFADTTFLQGKELSYNNILDLDAATALAFEFRTPAVAIIKHTNPCGLAVGRDGEDVGPIFQKALSCDPKSAFGGIVAVNRTVDKTTAEGICSLFTECVAAPEYTPEALAVLRTKPNLRVVVWGKHKNADSALQVRSVDGGFLLQSRDNDPLDKEDWRIVTKVRPNDREYFDLQIGMVAAKHVKSNAIVYVKDGKAVGVGAGQMSRIDSARFAALKAQEQGHDLKGAILASDAFFPFADTVEFANSLGISAIVQPGGSKKDQDSVDAADKCGISMVFTGRRHFRH